MDMTMPDQQTDPKVDKILEQLGLHPSQINARQSLGLGSNLDNISGVTPTSPAAMTAAPKLIQDTPNPQTATTAPVAAPKIPSPISTPTVTPTPGATTTEPPDLIKTNSTNQIQNAQNELQRMHTTGSGISQIQNPFLRTLARVGDIAATGLFPNIERAIPGTEGHHRDLESQENNLIQTGEKTKGEETTQEAQEAQTEKTERTPTPTSDLSEWLKQNPGKPIEDYWNQKSSAEANAKVGQTPEEQTFRYLTSPKEKGGQGMTQPDALDKIETLKASNKPDSKQQETQALEGLLAKAMPGGTIDPSIMSDSKKLGNFISRSPALNDDEKSRLLTHFIFNSSPASQGTQANIRIEGMENSRMFPSIDKTTGTLAYPSAAEMNASPGRYIPATQGGTSMTKESIFSDLHFNIAQTREAIKNLKTPFTTGQAAQLAVVLRSSDPHSALDSFFHSQAGRSLTPDQVDYVTSLASLGENALAVRSIAGLGQGSDEMRAAITKTIPGPGTPTEDYANRQLALFEGTVNRLEKGVPKSGVKQGENPPVAKTGEGGTPPGKTFTKSQLTSLVTDKKNNPGGLTYDQLKADAESKGHKVDESK